MVTIEEICTRWCGAVESKKLMALLPLLEHGYPAALEQSKDTPLEQVNFSALIEYALGWPTGGGWSLRAVEWLECGFPMTPAISELLISNSRNSKKCSQNERHRSQRLVSEFIKSRQRETSGITDGTIYQKD
ncbi:hypothetical protein [Parathalassolituus penaei]|uniref:hypothetical protein n=1 Tax=Parathalassolituus penaei TaxID=2997323 RepID=UPI0024B35061|nr:hypothetical protein [Parathalassolituus penaei]